MTDKIDGMMRDFGFFIAKWPKVLSFLSIAMLIVIASNLPKTTVDTSTEGFLLETSPTRVATEIIDHEVQGSISLELIVDSGKQNGLYDIKLLRAIKSSGQSYQIAFVVISIMMMLMLRSIKLGLLSMLPNLFPIFFLHQP